MRKNDNSKHRIPFGWHEPTQRMVTVTEVANGRACECLCAACRAPLQARQGAIRTWYFAHDVESDCQHATETAIHRMAKQMIVERGSIFVPRCERSRVIHGRAHVWSETIVVEVQAAGLQHLTGCIQEVTLGDRRKEGDSRRPDVFAYLDGLPIALEIRNTHAVDDTKQEWLKNRNHSALEIDVADIAALPPDLIPAALEERLFSASAHSVWLCHAKDALAYAELDALEHHLRIQHAKEESRMVALREAEQARRRRREDARLRYRDIEAVKLRVGTCTIRVARNQWRVSLKIHGYASDQAFNRALLLARQHHGQFNPKARCWEFFCNNSQPFFRHLCNEVKTSVSGTFSHTPQVLRGQQATGSATVRDPAVMVLPFDCCADSSLEEAFEERAAIFEYEAGLTRPEAEQRAHADVAQLQAQALRTLSVQTEVPHALRQGGNHEPGIGGLVDRLT